MNGTFRMKIPIEVEIIYDSEDTYEIRLLEEFRLSALRVAGKQECFLEELNDHDNEICQKIEEHINENDEEDVEED